MTKLGGFAQAVVRDPIPKAPAVRDPLKPPKGPAPSKPYAQKPSTVKQPKAPKPPAAVRAPGIKNAGRNANPNKPGAPFPNPANNTGAKGGGSKGAKGGNKAGAAAANPYSILAPLTPAQIKAQANATISASYKPSFSDLNSEQSQLAAINAKRAQDNVTYENWMAGQTQSILAAGSAADAAYSGQLASARQATMGALANQSADAVAAANDRQGNVSNNATSTPLTSGIAQNQALNDASLGVTEQSGLATGATSGTSLKASALNNEGRIGENIATQQEDYNTSLGQIATQRSQLQLSKAGDIAKEIARLQGVEIQKAQTAQQYSLAQQTLTGNQVHQAAQDANTAAQIKAGEQAAKYAHEQFTSTMNFNRWKVKYETMNSNSQAAIARAATLTQNQLSNALSNKQFVENVKTDGWAHAGAIWKQNHPDAGKTPPAPAHAGNPGDSPLTANEQNEDYDKIHSIVGQLNQIFPNYAGVKGSDTTVYRTLLDGGSLQVPTPDPNNPGHQLKSATGVPEFTTVSFANYDPALVNAAFTLSNFRKGKNTLTPGEIAKLRALGLRNVTQHI